MGDTGPCDSDKINHVYSSHTILNTKFGVNRMLHVFKTPVHRFDRFGILNLVRIGRSMSSRPQYTDLTTMGGSGPCEAMRIIFGSVI